MGGGHLQITIPRPLPFMEQAKKTPVSCSRSHNYFQWQNQDQKPKSPGFQSHTLSNTTNVQFHSCEVFLFVFLSSKFLEINCSFGDQVWISSILVFDLWNNLQTEKGDRKGGSLIPVFQSFSPQENLNSWGHWLSSMIWRPKTFLPKSFGSEIFKLHWFSISSQRSFHTELVIKDQLSKQREKIFINSVKCEEYLKERDAGWKSGDHRSA